MGVGYQVSALHQMMYLDKASIQTRAVVKGEDPLLDALGQSFDQITVAKGPLRTRSPDVASVLAWRQRLQIKYRDQLGEELTWDERGTFEASSDVATSGDARFRYVAAVLDQRGPAGVKELLHQRRPPGEEAGAVFTEADRRGFGGRFPQLLLGATIWLPFDRNLVIEEPDWDGKMARYGSVLRLLDELSSARAGIADADPTVARLGEFAESSEEVLAAAWQASTTIFRLTTLATAKRLPLWTTG